MYRYASNGVIYEGVWTSDKRVEKYSKALRDKVLAYSNPFCENILVKPFRIILQTYNRQNLTKEDNSHKISLGNVAEEMTAIGNLVETEALNSFPRKHDEVTSFPGKTNPTTERKLSSSEKVKNVICHPKGLYRELRSHQKPLQGSSVHSLPVVTSKNQLSDSDVYAKSLTSSSYISSTSLSSASIIISTDDSHCLEQDSVETSEIPNKSKNDYPFMASDEDVDSTSQDHFKEKLEEASTYRPIH